MNPMPLDYAPPSHRSPWRRVLLFTLPVAVVVGLLAYRARRIPPAPAPPAPTVPMYRVVGTSKDGVTVSIWIQDYQGDAANAQKIAGLFIARRTAAQMPPTSVVVLRPKTPRWPEWVMTTRPAGK